MNAVAFVSCLAQEKSSIESYISFIHQLFPTEGNPDENKSFSRYNGKVCFHEFLSVIHYFNNHGITHMLLSRCKAGLNKSKREPREDVCMFLMSCLEGNPVTSARIS